MTAVSKKKTRLFEKIICIMFESQETILLIYRHIINAGINLYNDSCVDKQFRCIFIPMNTNMLLNNLNRTRRLAGRERSKSG